MWPRIYCFLAALIAASTAHGAPAAPPDVVIVACRAEIKTVFAKPQIPIPNIMYWQLALNKWGEYECQRTELNNLQDEVTGEPAPTVTIDDPANITFQNFSNCSRLGMMKSMDYEQKNPGWLVVAVGCPVPILDDNGTPADTADDHIVGWKLPGCPVYLPGTTNRMVCRFDKSHI